jgi:hypothetical protein
MSQMTLKAFAIEPDRKELAIELWEDDKPIGHITFPAADAERLIAYIAQQRAAMSDEVPRLSATDSEAGGVIDPVWNVPPYQPAHERVLRLRHPGLGWLSFVLPQHEARSIAQALLTDAAQQTAAA